MLFKITVIQKQEENNEVEITVTQNQGFWSKVATCLKVTAIASEAFIEFQP